MHCHFDFFKNEKALKSIIHHTEKLSVFRKKPSHQEDGVTRDVEENDDDDDECKSNRY